LIIKKGSGVLAKFIGVSSRFIWVLKRLTKVGGIVINGFNILLEGGAC